MAQFHNHNKCNILKGEIFGSVINKDEWKNLGDSRFRRAQFFHEERASILASEEKQQICLGHPPNPTTSVSTTRNHLKQ